MASDPPTIDLNVPEETAATAAATVAAADQTPSLPAVPSHPPYDEMIKEAIASLNEGDGSSKRAIASYIETQHSNLLPNHASLLSTHLKHLADDGQILRDKNSYKLPRDAPPPPVSVNGADSVGQKKRPGRPSKRKPVQDAVPVFGEQSVLENPQLQNAATGPLGSVNVVTGLVGEPVVDGTPIRRGRPPKLAVKRGRGRPTRNGGVQASVGRSRGRPKKNAASPVVAGTSRGRGPGRPRKVADVEGGVADVDGGTVGSTAIVADTGGPSTVAGGGVSQVARKRRGRPPNSGSKAKKPREMVTLGASTAAGGGLSQVAGKRRGRRPKETGSEVQTPAKVAAGGPRKPRKLSGKPLGRPKRTASTGGSQAPLNPQQFAGLDPNGKLQYFQSRIKHSVNIIKPHLNRATATTALRELESLAEMDVNAPSNVPPQS
ncbi:uncharacterized protein [Henckelia pumila]|uniref:uncharacterized protein n=1 Tax=Henckelia pumila TaxID=405737 RepID=UPI003C6DC25D